MRMNEEVADCTMRFLQGFTGCTMHGASQCEQSKAWEMGEIG